MFLLWHYLYLCVLNWVTFPWGLCIHRIVNSLC
jgi:hypothetical protein